VNDMIVIGNNIDEMIKLKTHLLYDFDMKDLRNLKYFLGIKVIKSKQEIFF
jgi:hypothetical protein